MAQHEELIPVNLLTGSLGSGKTSLLQQLLSSPQLANTAVLMNEFGEIGLDHLLLESVDDELVVLQTGCVCCTIRGELSTAIRDLYDRRQRGQIPAFERLAIETTGLADPAPIVFTLTAEPVLRHHFRLGNVITTVDAVNGEQQLGANPETAKQVAVADRVVLTKSDIAEAGGVARLKAQLTRLNPAAPVIDAQSQPIEPNALMANDVYDPASKSEEVRRWLAAEAKMGHAQSTHGLDASRHDAEITTFCATFDVPLDWTAFGLWLSMLLNCHGENVLRVKGILDVGGMPGPVVIHGVQHIVHPPVHLERWPSDDRRSRIVFIVRGLEREAIERSLAAFNGLANPSELTVQRG